MPKVQIVSSGHQVDFVPSNPLQIIQALCTSITTSLTTSLRALPPSVLDQDTMQPLLEAIRSAGEIHSLSKTIFPAAIPTSDFIQFPKLPTELRCAIWKFALPGPRVIQVTKKICIQDDGTKYEKLRLNLDIPAMIHACRESRQTCLEKYSKKLGSRTRVYKNDCARFDPKDDTLYAPDLNLFLNTSLRRISVGAVRAVQFLIVKYDDWEDIERQRGKAEITLPELQSLKLITFILEGHDSVDHCDHCEVSSTGVGEYVTVIHEHLPADLSSTRDKLLLSMQRMKERRKKPEWAQWKLPEIKFGHLVKKERAPRRMYWGLQDNN